MKSLSKAAFHMICEMGGLPEDSVHLFQLEDIVYRVLDQMSPP